MNTYQLHLRYVYTFYRFDDVLACDVADERVGICPGTRFKLRDQEDSTFLISELHDGNGAFAVLTFPNKDNLLLPLGEETELAYDEFYDAMGDNNHNVYEGTVTLVRKS